MLNFDASVHASVRWAFEIDPVGYYNNELQTRE